VVVNIVMASTHIG